MDPLALGVAVLLGLLLIGGLVWLLYFRSSAAPQPKCVYRAGLGNEYYAVPATWAVNERADSRMQHVTGPPRCRIVPHAGRQQQLQ